MKSLSLLRDNENLLWSSYRLSKINIMKLAIMQPYFFPYIGYFQLIASVDRFIVYDNIKYTKRGWINRNRLLLNGKDALFSLPLKNDSDYLNICNRELAEDFSRDKLLNQFMGAYRQAPYFKETFLLIEKIICNQDTNLFQYLYYSITNICNHLGLKTEIKKSSDFTIAPELKNQNKVLALCEASGADIYVNPIGGIDLYSKDVFLDGGVDLRFIQSFPLEYCQYGNSFVPWLSIIDVMMFNSTDTIQHYLTTSYELI
jgi:hypothetical protein